MKEIRPPSVWLLAFLVLVSTSGGTSIGQQSTSYKIERLSITTLASTASSPSFDTSLSTDMMSGAAGVCPSGASVTLGFWSFLGPTAVPVILRLGKSGDVIDLFWTGQSDGFTVYRATDPADVEDPGNVLLTTTACDATDSALTTPDLLFYVVTN